MQTVWEGNSLLIDNSLCSESCRPMHEITFATVDKPKLLSQVGNLFHPWNNVKLSDKVTHNQPMLTVSEVQ